MLRCRNVDTYGISLGLGGGGGGGLLLTFHDFHFLEMNRHSIMLDTDSKINVNTQEIKCSRKYILRNGVSWSMHFFSRGIKHNQTGGRTTETHISRTQNICLLYWLELGLIQINKGKKKKRNGTLHQKIHLAQ